MAYKSFVVPDIGTVNVYKRRGSTNIRLSVTPKGIVRVNIPAWVPYTSGLSFVNKRADWLRLQLAKTNKKLLLDGDKVGKSHRLNFIYNDSNLKPNSRLKPNQVVITASRTTDPIIIQAVAVKAVERALKKESEMLLPQRLDTLARKHGLTYKSASVRKLTSRWGSCSSKNDITLSYYLIQLDWKLIDYVLLHELVHTKHKNHGADFWELLVKILPDAKATRKLLNQNQTLVTTREY